LPISSLQALATNRCSHRAQYQAGFAIEDFSALRYVRDMLGKPGMSDLCEDLDLIADPDDPRDLYGMVQRHGSVSVAA
jgi:hypothetical protein